MLGVFLLPAFTRLGRERQDLLSPCDEICMCAQTRPRFILSSEGVFGRMEFEPMLTPREKSPLPENVPRGGSNPRRCGQRAQALPTELFRPPIQLSISPSHGILTPDHPVPRLTLYRQAPDRLATAGPRKLGYRHILNAVLPVLLSVGPINRLVCLWDGSVRTTAALPHRDRSCRSNCLSHPVTY